MAGYNDVSKGSPESADTVNQPAELTHGADTSHPPLLPTSLPRGGNSHPTLLLKDTNIENDPTTNGRVGKCP